MPVSHLIGHARSAWRVLLLTIALAATTGCESVAYYHQAISGHWQIVNKTRSIGDVLDDPNLDADLRRQLTLVQQAREFATRDLRLPDNDSYRSYADLERRYVVWNVFAAPELSLEPVQSCFLFVGCLAYRGYFDEAQARAFATELAAQGHEVFVGGVAAYSTLGWFDDPVLNTMLVWDDRRLVNVIFHELAHQLIYVKDDSVFNESFATTVGQVGAERWFANDAVAPLPDPNEDKREQAFFDLLLASRDELNAVFSAAMNDDEKRARKSDVYAALLQNYEHFKAQWQGYAGYDEWMYDNLNNAKLASVATYNSQVGNFRAILESVDNDLGQFYAVVEKIATLSAEARERCFADAAEVAQRCGIELASE